MTIATMNTLTDDEIDLLRECVTSDELLELSEGLRIAGRVIHKIAATIDARRELREAEQDFRKDLDAQRVN